jgi:hypothetical protein
MTVKSLRRAYPLPYRFEISPHLARARREPLTGVTVHHVDVGGLDNFFVYPVLPHTTSFDHPRVGPRIRMPYVQDAYLTAIGWASPAVNEPACGVLVELPRTATVSLVKIIGQLGWPVPEWDMRGPATNFCIPKTLRIFAMKSLYDPYDSWVECVSETNCRGLWGWTPFEFEPVSARYLYLAFADLPTVQSLVGPIKIVWLSRIAVFPFTDIAEASDDVDYTPVSAFTDRFDVVPSYWQNAGVAAPAADNHQSIYRDQSPESPRTIVTATGPQVVRGMDLLPSALVGMPMEYPDAETDSWVSIPYYSSAVTNGGTKLALTLRINAGGSAAIRGCQLMEPFPRRLENQGMPLDIGGLDVLVTDEPDAAFSSDFSQQGWSPVHRTRVSVLQFAPAAVPYFAFRTLFDEPVCASFVRLVFNFLPAYTSTRRLELSSLVLLRDPHFTLRPPNDRDFVVTEVSLRLMGPQLADDYGQVNGGELFDIRLEESQSGKPWTALLQLRHLLDIREQVRNQVIANARHAKTTEFYEEEVGSNSDLVRSQYATESKTFQTSIVHPIAGVPRSASHQRLSYGPGQVEVERWFPGDTFEEILTNRPYTQTLGGGFIVSGSTSTQINGGLTASSTSGWQETNEVRVADYSVSGLHTYVNSIPDPAHSWSHADTDSERKRSIKRVELDHQSNVDIVRGRQVFFEGSPSDIVSASIPVKLRLRGKDGRDRLRLAVYHLPANVRLKVVFRGYAVMPEVDHGA